MGDEEGGITTLQLLEAELATLKKTLRGVEAAQNTGKASAKVLPSILECQSLDSFLVREGVADHNVYHTSAGGGGGDGGCCLVL
jgi:hypothetical protein